MRFLQKNLQYFIKYSFLMAFLFSCQGLQQTSLKNQRKTRANKTGHTEKRTVLKEKDRNDRNEKSKEELPLRSVSEIRTMINRLMSGAKVSNNGSKSYYGIDQRNNLVLVIIIYWDGDKDNPFSFNRFLIYESVDWGDCYRLNAQPLINPETNRYIGCEPSVSSEN